MPLIFATNLNSSSDKFRIFILLKKFKKKKKSLLLALSCTKFDKILRENVV